MSNCRLCAGALSPPVFPELPDYFAGSAHVESYSRCSSCGLLQAISRADDLGAFYEGYNLHQAHGALYKRIRHFFLRRAYDSARPPTRGARLLDYGCGDGGYLMQMRRRGWDIAGIELDAQHAPALARELGCPVFTPDSAPSSWQGAFDKVTLNMVLEHVEEPAELLDRVASWLRPGGELFLSIPNIEGLEARLFGRRWLDLDPPRHRTFLTRAHLGQLFAKSGFRARGFAERSVGTSFAGSVQHLFSNRCDPRVMTALLPAGEVWSLFVRDACLLAWAERK